MSVVFTAFHVSVEPQWEWRTFVVAVLDLSALVNGLLSNTGAISETGTINCRLTSGPGVCKGEAWALLFVGQLAWKQLSVKPGHQRPYSATRAFPHHCVCISVLSHRWRASAPNAPQSAFIWARKSVRSPANWTACMVTWWSQNLSQIAGVMF